MIKKKKVLQKNQKKQDTIFIHQSIFRFGAIFFLNILFQIN